MLEFTTDLTEAVRSAELVMVAVGTPPGRDGVPELAQVNAAVRAIDEKLRRLWVSALQSKLFNDVLARRLKPELAPHALRVGELDPAHRHRLEMAAHRERAHIDRLEAQVGRKRHHGLLRVRIVARAVTIVLGRPLAKSAITGVAPADASA